MQRQAILNREILDVCVCLYKTGSHYVAHASHSGLASDSTLLPLPLEELGLEAHTTILGSYISILLLVSLFVWVSWKLLTSRLQ